MEPLTVILPLTVSQDDRNRWKPRSMEVPNGRSWLASIEGSIFPRGLVGKFDPILSISGVARQLRPENSHGTLTLR